jgi:hypothetical protein
MPSKYPHPSGELWAFWKWADIPSSVNKGQVLTVSNKPTLYLAGPMTGYPDWNFPLFNRTAADLRRLGYRVLNPADNGLDETDWTVCMRRAIAMLIQADALALLPGWQESKGARLEHIIASALGMDVRNVDVLLTEVTHV